MILTPLSKITPGMNLALPVIDSAHPDRDLLMAGSVLAESSLKELTHHGITECWVSDDRLEHLKPSIEELFSVQREALIFLQNTFLSCRNNQILQISVKEPLEFIKRFTGILRNNQSTALISGNLIQGGVPLVHHSINVCLASLSLCIRLENYIAKERPTLEHSHAIDPVNLGMGALFHDAGYLLLPEHFSSRSAAPLTTEESHLIRQHPTLGFSALRNTLEASASNAVLNHHQRFDGLGYPLGGEGARTATDRLCGTDIPIFSRIIAVADTFFTALNHSQKAETMEVRALYEMRFSLFRNWFDPVVEKAFYHMMPPFPLGSRVTLSSGEEAVVQRFNPTAPCHPSVKLLSDSKGLPLPSANRDELDLSVCSDTHIRFYKEKNVSAFLF